MINRLQHQSTLWICLLVMLLSVLMLSACNAKGAKVEAMDERPVVSIMAPLHFPNPPTPESIREIEKLTDIRLDVNWVPDGIYTDKMNTALSTSSFKKATFVKYTDYIYVKNEIRSGAFWEIGPYLDQFPNLKHLDKNILNQAAVDGKIFGLYTERPSSRQGIIIRGDWLDKLQLSKPKTLDDLYEVMRKFTYQDPDGNGKNDTIGLADRNDLVFGAFKTLSSYFGAPNNWEVSKDRLIPEFETPAYMDTMNFMKKLYDEKLINQDFAVTSKEVQRNLMIRGTAGVYIGSMTDVQRLSDEAKLINPNVSFTLVNRIDGPKGNRVWSIPNYNGLYLFSKKAIKTEEELKQILRFFDRTMDKDVANLLRYGFEGRHYTVENGKVHLPEETSQLRVNEVNALYPLMIADLNNPNVMEVAEKESLTKIAEQLSLDNEKFVVNDPTFNLESKTYDERGLELYKIISDSTYNYILGHIDKERFYQEVERWKQNGGNQIIKEYQDSYLKK